jgi:transcriptional regulator with XRE-family HTH domain
MRTLNLAAIGQAIRQRREEDKISQEKLSELSLVSPPTITRLEQGKAKDISVQKLHRIAESLEYELPDLIEIGLLENHDGHH